MVPISMVDKRITGESVSDAIVINKIAVTLQGM